MAFSNEAFQLLNRLHQNPQNNIDEEDIDAFRKNVIVPMRELFLDHVNPGLPKAITDVMQFDVEESFARSPIDDLSKGSITGSYEVVCYPKRSIDKQQDVQLFVLINHQGLAFGFTFGRHVARSKKVKFLSNYTQLCQDKFSRSRLMQLLEKHLPTEELPLSYRYSIAGVDLCNTEGDDYVYWQDFLKDLEVTHLGSLPTFSPMLKMSAESVLSIPTELLANTILLTCICLFPFVLIATSSEPVETVTTYIEESTAFDLVRNSATTLKQLNEFWEYLNSDYFIPLENTPKHVEPRVHQKNPPWAKDELILALDLYFRENPSPISASHPEVIELSNILNELPIHSDRPDKERFRNPNGVYMKLCNFLRFDPNYAGSGLKAGGKLEEEIWNDFANDRERLHAIAKAIRSGILTSGNKDTAPVADLADEEAPEGKILLRQHKVRERNAALVKKKKAQVLQTYGELKCEVCDFSFTQCYGALGEGYIECHHTVPVSQLKPNQKTHIKDLALVCANCHRMLHRGGELLTIGALKTIMAISKSS